MLKLLTASGELHKAITYYYALVSFSKNDTSYHLRRVCAFTGMDLGCQFVKELPRNEFLVKSFSAMPKVYFNV